MNRPKTLSAAFVLDAFAGNGPHLPIRNWTGSPPATPKRASGEGRGNCADAALPTPSSPWLVASYGAVVVGTTLDGRGSCDG